LLVSVSRGGNQFKVPSAVADIFLSDVHVKRQRFTPTERAQKLRILAEVNRTVGPSASERAFDKAD
jgi:hypothetical protein